MRWRTSPGLASRRQRRQGARRSAVAVSEIGGAWRVGRGVGRGMYFKGTGGRFAWSWLGGLVEEVVREEDIISDGKFVLREM